MEREKQFIRNSITGDVSRLYVIDCVAERCCRYNVLDIFHSQEANDLKVWTTDVHILLRDDHEKLPKAVGFRAVDFYGTYNFDSYNKETSLRLIAMARK